MILKVEKLKEIINQNSMGHLPLAYRVDLMKQIGDTRTVQKVFMFSITSFKGDIITLNTRNTDKICNAFRNIRELMYNKNSKQSAWFQVEMFLKSKVNIFSSSIMITLSKFLLFFRNLIGCWRCLGNILEAKNIHLSG